MFFTVDGKHFIATKYGIKICIILVAEKGHTSFIGSTTKFSMSNVLAANASETITRQHYTHANIDASYQQQQRRLIKGATSSRCTFLLKNIHYWWHILVQNVYHKSVSLPTFKFQILIVL